MPSYTVAQRARVFALENRVAALEKRLEELEQPEEVVTNIEMNVSSPVYLPKGWKSGVEVVPIRHVWVPSAEELVRLLAAEARTRPPCLHCDRGYGELHKPGCRRVTQTYGVAGRGGPI